VNAALPFDLIRGLELGREASFELTEADVVEPGGVYVVGGEPATVL
jgi:hypothetical protein